MQLSVPPGCVFAPLTETPGCNKQVRYRSSGSLFHGYVVSAWKSGGHIFVYLAEGVVNSKGEVVGCLPVSSLRPCFSCTFNQIRPTNSAIEKRNQIKELLASINARIDQNVFMPDGSNQRTRVWNVGALLLWPKDNCLRYALVYRYTDKVVTPNSHLHVAKQGDLPCLPESQLSYRRFLLLWSWVYVDAWER